ncbi:hypothetical protein OG267_05290 [Kitasatospora herbaricolor]|nr:hypothetical protein [Kitasatospora herbaricolor]
MRTVSGSQGLRQIGGVVLGALAALGLLRLAGAYFATIGAPARGRA